MTTSIGYLYRRLDSGNVGMLRDLMRAFADVFEDNESYQSSKPSDAYLANVLAKPHFIAIVATADQEVVGGLTAYVLDKVEQDRREIYIYDLAVVEAHRRQRVATRLIETLRDVARKVDAYVIFVQADLVDGPAIALYQSLGTLETAHHFDIEVKRRSPTK